MMLDLRRQLHLVSDLRGSFQSFLLLLFLTGGQLLYNVTLISTVQQRESAISTHISPPS